LWVVVVYLVGGSAAGIATGILLPLARWTAGAALVGIVAAVPLGYFGLRAIGGAAPWGREDTLVLAIFALAFGGPAGMLYREIFLDSKK